MFLSVKTPPKITINWSANYNTVNTKQISQTTHEASLKAHTVKGANMKG